jgi:hypothetical protein
MKLPPMPPMTGPKSTVCEVQRWIATTVKEAQAAKERFVPASPPQSGKAGDTRDEHCEAYRWVRASVEDVLKLVSREAGRMQEAGTSASRPAVARKPDTSL